MNKVLVITGPTATGKTALAVEMAKKFDGELLSADSRQVYKYMDIATGKFKQGWGIDLVDPDYDYNVGEYVKYATQKIEEIQNRNKLPIIVGGTGLYIKELLNPSETLFIKPNKKLREKLFKKSVLELQKELQKINLNKWETMNNSDRNNPRRLVRAIEVTGKQEDAIASLQHDALVIGLTADLKVLYERIDKRVEERIEEGAFEEREKLNEMGYYPNCFGYIEKNVQEWKNNEHGYAKRQLTYLKKYFPKALWFDIAEKNKIEAVVRQWYSSDNG